MYVQNGRQAYYLVNMAQFTAYNERKKKWKSRHWHDHHMTYYSAYERRWQNLHALHSIHTTYCSNSTGSVELQNKHSLYNPQFRPHFILNVLHWWLENAHFWICGNTKVLGHFLVFSIVAYCLHLNVSVCIELHNYQLNFHTFTCGNIGLAFLFILYNLKGGHKGLWAILAQRAQINFGNLPEIVYHPGTFGILFSTYYDLGCKKNPYLAYYLGQTVCEVNICALDSIQREYLCVPMGNNKFQNKTKGFNDHSWT